MKSAIMQCPVQVAHKDDLNSVARQMGKWVDQITGVGFHKFRPTETWMPAVNIYADNRDYHVVMDLAGLKGEEIDVRAKTGLLVISGSRKMPVVAAQQGHLKVQLMEIDHGPFCRTLDLPLDADVEHINARYREGYLWVRIPRKA